MPDLIATVAVVGRALLMPGILPIRLESPTVECFVNHAFQSFIEAPQRGIKIDISDCTLFTVTHRDRGDVDLTIVQNVRTVFEQSLAAISEVLIWTKTRDVAGKMSPYSRQIGTIDVKAFFAQGVTETLVGWLNPAFTLDRNAAATIAAFLPMIILNGPAAVPVPAITRRVMSSLDLVNLGFHTESFVNMFSLVDDITQEVIKAGMTKRGISPENQKDLLRAIKEERLKHYLCNLAKLCGWDDLEESQKNLYDRVLKINTLRNNIMHGSRRLTPSEAVNGIEVLLLLINWLRSNPFGFLIPGFPLLKLAEPEFALVPLKIEQTASTEQPSDGTPSDRGA